ncbi:MAG: DUF4293 domain-containing protein [Dysgonamonadaceae bacterium]|jgi:hypothetical protein|nr:DUF4293 domain-containing protein [Dysgonamonadaceae bacterium]
MIQRIQSVYLILIAGIMLAMLFLSLPGIPTALVYGLAALLSFVTIFYYKKRSLQINLCYVILVLTLSSYAVAYFVVGLPGKDSLCNINCILSMALPLVAIVLDLLAIIGIKKDDKLVKSLDRLR